MREVLTILTSCETDHPVIVERTQGTIEEFLQSHTQSSKLHETQRGQLPMVPAPKVAVGNRLNREATGQHIFKIKQATTLTSEDKTRSEGPWTHISASWLLRSARQSGDLGELRWVPAEAASPVRFRQRERKQDRRGGTSAGTSHRERA